MSEPRDDIESLWDFHDPASTEQRFRAILAERMDANRLTSNEVFTAELHTQIARTCSLQSRFAEAHAMLDDVERWLATECPAIENWDKAAGRVQIRLWLERGRTFNSSGNPAGAQPLFERAWSLARSQCEDVLAIDAAHMLAIVCATSTSASPAQSQQWNELALDLAERSTEPRARRWRASIHNNIAWYYHERGEFERALSSFEQALAMRIEQGDERETRIARWCVARCLRSLGRLEHALAIQLSLRSESESSGLPHDGFVDEEIGECLLALGRETEARSYFASAHRVLHAAAALEPSRLDRLARLAAPPT